MFPLDDLRDRNTAKINGRREVLGRLPAVVLEKIALVGPRSEVVLYFPFPLGGTDQDYNLRGELGEHPRYRIAIAFTQGSERESP